MQKIFITLLFFSLAHAAIAQQKSPSMQEMEKQMQQFMEEFQKSISGGSFFTMPGGDSSYTFRFDTTIIGDNFSGSFHFGPFGGDSTMRGDLFGSDLFNQFFKGMDDNFWRGSAPEEVPERGSSDDESLLPEERLRLEEEKERSGKDSSGKTQPAEPKKPKIKTIRI